MSKKRLFWVGMVALLAFAAPTFAQDGDRDGDGVPDRIDRCPDQPGPRENEGCPFPVTEGDGGIPDRDSDGVADFVDLCPDEAGTGFTDGCPVGAAPDAPQVVMLWDSMDVCMVGVPLTSSANVNIREYPTVNSSIIGQLMPGQQFASFFRDYDENSSVWFGGAPVGGGDWGWVAGSAVIDNGQCANLPMIIHLDAPYQPSIELTLDPDQLPDSSVYLSVKLENTLISSYQYSLLIPDSFAVSEGENDAAGGTQSTDDWDTPTYFGLFELLPEEDLALGGQSFEPLLLVKPVDPNAPDEGCADVGEGFCLLAGLLLPATGDTPDQCPPQTFADGLQAAFPGAASGDGDSDGRDFLIWQRNLGSSAAMDTGSVLLPQYAINGNSLGLLLPAVQAIREVASQSGEPKPGTFEALLGDGSVLPADGSSVHVESISLTYQRIELEQISSCAMIGFVPNGDTAVLGDGSVRPGFDTFVLLLPAGQSG
jgi:hypothetical protein